MKKVILLTSLLIGGVGLAVLFSPNLNPVLKKETSSFISDPVISMNTAQQSSVSSDQIKKQIPPEQIPPELIQAFTLNGEIPVSNWYIDETYSTPLTYNKEIYDSYIQKALNRETLYYGNTDIQLYQALDELADTIKGKEVAVIGSTIPWYESILLTYGAKPVVIEYNAVQSDDPRVTYLTPEQYWKNPRQFDLVLSISSTEHDGLGRYGDPIDPNGDLKSMTNFKKMLTPNGQLLIAVPSGADELVWNAHRIYGPKRYKLLFDGWDQVKYYGIPHEQIPANIGAGYQPVYLLKPT